MTTPTVKEMTIDYNRMATAMGEPLVKKLKPTKAFPTVRDRYDDMVRRHQFKMGRTLNDPATPSETPKQEKDRVEKETAKALEQNAKAATRDAAAGIKHTRPGTSIHLLIECVIAGGTVGELHNMMNRIWTENSIRAALAWDIPKKGYHVAKRESDKGTVYQIDNAQVVV